MDDFRKPADDGMLADPTELVRGGEPRDDRVVTDGDVSGKAAVVGKDDVIPQLAIVRDVGIAEEKIVRADARGQLLMRATVDRAVLTEDVVIAYFQSCRLTDVFEILGFPADGSEGEKLVAFPKAGVALQDDMRVQHAIIAEDHTGTDDGVGADVDVSAELGLGGNDGGGVDHRRSFSAATPL